MARRTYHISLVFNNAFLVNEQLKERWICREIKVKMNAPSGSSKFIQITASYSFCSSPSIFIFHAVSTSL